MRVLALVTDAFGGRGGIAEYNRHFLRALCEWPNATEVVTVPRLMPDAPGELPEKLTYVCTGQGGKIRYLLTVLGLVFDRRGFDLIYCGHINLLPLAHLMKRLLRKPIVLQIYGIDAWSPTQNRWIDRMVAGVDLCLSISRATRRHFLTWALLPPNRVRVLPVTFSSGQFAMGARSPSLLERYNLRDKSVLMTLCRLSKEERYKGVDEVLETLPDLLKHKPNVAYLIAGEGDDRLRLEQKAAALGIADRVVFAGAVPEAEKADHYRLADTFVMPSRGEGFGIVFLEALACGVPVIAGDADGARDALRDGRLGLLVDSKDVAGLNAAILQALDSPHEVPVGLACFAPAPFVMHAQLLIGSLR